MRKQGAIMKQTERPIAVFDSGVGGISVLRELVRLMPNENYIFFGDSKNAPYGGKSLEEVRKLTECHVRHLLSEGAKAVVIACNTATSADVSILRKEYPDVPVVGIEPYGASTGTCYGNANDNPGRKISTAYGTV